MKCRHRGRNFEWYTCPECGKMIRVNRMRDIVRWSVTILYTLFGAEAFADYALKIFGLTENNPYNSVHTVIGGASIIILFDLLRLLIPYYDEKPEEETKQ